MYSEEWGYGKLGQMDSYIALRWGHCIYSLRKVRTNG